MKKNNALAKILRFVKNVCENLRAFLRKIYVHKIPLKKFRFLGFLSQFTRAHFARTLFARAKSTRDFTKQKNILQSQIFTKSQNLISKIKSSKIYLNDSAIAQSQKKKISVFSRLALKEALRLLSRHKVLCLIYVVLPLLVGWFIYAVFMASLPRDLPIGVVDFDRSVASDEALFMIDSSATTKITKSYQNISQAKEDLSVNKIYALVVIPQNYERDIKQGNGTTIALYFNAQFVLIGKAISSALEGVIGTLNAKQWSGKNLVKSQNLSLSIASSMPIFSQIIPLYNSSNNYSQFMLTLLLPCMLQILSALGMLHLLRKPPSSLKSLITRYVFNSLVFVFWALFQIVLLKKLGFENRGDLGILLCGSALLVFGVNGVVVCIQSVINDFKKAVGFVAIYTAPSLAFAGVTYPQNAMNVLALFWSKFLPISHFMELFIQQANYGGEMDLGFKILGGMLWFLLFFVLGVGIYAIRFGWEFLPKIPNFAKKNAQ
ncbi:ABC transporter permease [Helicobacter sp. T3_23-1056]